MKKSCISILFIAFVPLFVFCNHKTGFTINGTVRGLDTGTVEIVYRSSTGDDTSVTSRITAGKFILSGQVPEPELARFNIRTGWPYSISFFAENTNMTFGLVKGDEDKTVISGSSSNILYRQLEPQLRAFFANARNYDNTHEQALNNHNAPGIASADSVWAAQLKEWTGSIRKAISDEPKNYAGLYFINWLLFHPMNYDTIMSLYTGLDPVVKSGLSGKDFLAAFHHARQISIGQAAPEISGKDTSGNIITLASLKGKVVLLDFWASYCIACRRENPQLKAVYEKYHAAGFEILSFSLDNNRAAWIHAIQTDKLTWHHASELRGGASASAAVYDVQDMPRNWLIDASGNIIAKDLSNTALDEKLKLILNMRGK